MTESWRGGGPDQVALVGPRAVGKSTLGAQLARALGWAFVDTDVVLAERAGCAAGEYLATRGEPAFRVLEAEVVAACLAASAPAVLALGGGAVTSATVRAALHDPRVRVVWLDAPVEALLDRQRADPVRRPQLTSLSLREEIAHLRAQREPLWAEVAHVKVATAPGDLESCRARLLAAVQGLLARPR